MSRPREMDRATIRLFARSQLAQAIPALDILRTEVRDNTTPLDRSTAEDLLCKMVEDIDHVSEDASLTAKVEAVFGDPVAAAIQKYVKATRTKANAATVRSVIEQMTKDADNEQSMALLDIVLATTQPAKISTYAENLLDRMLAHGLTKNGTTPEKTRAILDIVADPNFGKGNKGTMTQAKPARPHPVVAAPWIDLPDPIPGFVFHREKRYNVLNQAVIAAGLPPATSIDFFEPGGALALANAEKNSVRAKLAWRAVESWLARTGAEDPHLDVHRRGGWTFLLGHVHGFLPGLSTFDNVRFASPHASDEVIYAKRVAEKAEGD